MSEQLREAIRLYMEEREWRRLHRCGSGGDFIGVGGAPTFALEFSWTGTFGLFQWPIRLR